MSDPQDTLPILSSSIQDTANWLWVKGVPDKGSLLTRLSACWFEFLKSEIPTLQTHFIARSLPPPLKESLPEELVLQLQNRTMQVRRLKVFPIEAIVRGYVSGSAWKEYAAKGTIHGMMVSGPGGSKLQESEKLESPIYTPCELLTSGLEQDGRSTEIANPD
jgi:phosphoribosylaminoimidazole-succinocarboxamide synthase